MNSKEAAKERAKILKKLRSEHESSVSRTQTLLKEQKKMQREICKFIREKSKTVPEISEALEVPTADVLWYLTAFRKYDIVEEDGMCGEYVLYKRKEE